LISALYGALEAQRKRQEEHVEKHHSRDATRTFRLAGPIIAVAVAGMSCSENTRSGRTPVPALGGSQQSATSDGSALNTAGETGAATLVAGNVAGAGHGGSPGSVAGTFEPPAAGSGGAPLPQGDAGSGVVLTAIVLQAARSGAPGIAAEWSNGTDQSIFLTGCSTVNGWYLQADGQWQEYGAFSSCTAETNAVEVGPGKTYVDRVGAAPPPANRGTNVWRLVGKYGVGCRQGQRLGASGCSELHELTSVNQLSWP
jgi:hypothetical protein